MEVHHRPDLHHKKKKLRKYFLEFMAIFLAVTPGFFAEIIGESISESLKARELAESLYAEVYSDSLNMSNKVKKGEKEHRAKLVLIPFADQARRALKPRYGYRCVEPYNIRKSSCPILIKKIPLLLNGGSITVS